MQSTPVAAAQEQSAPTLTRMFTKLEELSSKIDALEKKLSPSTPLKPNNSEWLSFEELRETLPEQLARSTLYNLISKGEVPYHKRGKKLYFLKSEIEAWLRSGRKKTMAEIREEAEMQLLEANGKTM